VHHLALGRERIDAVLDQFAVEFPEQAHIAFGAGIEQAPHPFDLAVERRIAGGRTACAARHAAGFLVAPVRGHAEFGLGMHVEGADLHFERLAFGADHGGVQRAVVVVLGPGDVVVELAGQRRPQRVDDAERGVAGGDVVDHHPHRAQVVELADRHALLLHLLPDAVDVLGPARYFGVQAVREQCLVEFAFDLLDVALAVAALAVEQAGDAAVGVGFQVAEGEVLELPLELPDTEAVGSGAWMSRVSWASARRSASGRVAACRKRASCRASRIGTTRRSRTIASSSRRRPSLPAPCALRSACRAQTWLAARWPSSSTCTFGCLRESSGASASASVGETWRMAAASTSPPDSSRASEARVSATTATGSRAPCSPVAMASRSSLRKDGAIAAHVPASSSSGDSLCRVSCSGGGTSGHEVRGVWLPYRVGARLAREPMRSRARRAPTASCAPAWRRAFSATPRPACPVPARTATPAVPPGPSAGPAIRARWRGQPLPPPAGRRRRA